MDFLMRFSHFLADLIVLENLSNQIRAALLVSGLLNNWKSSSGWNWSCSTTKKIGWWTD